MFEPDQYELIDFGNARKLERFGPFILDRPCPSADSFEPAAPELWREATARFEKGAGDQGRWKPANLLPPCWTIKHGDVVLEVKPTEFGHLGVFAEQASNWDWIAKRVRGAQRPLNVLNLFAYTGASTFAAAAAGANVVHVDSAKNTVAWARRNAELSGLADGPIRWIVEDTMKFVRREIKRGNRYDAVILDPPSFGRGPKGETWKLADQLMPLLRACAKLTAESRAFLLLTCHTAGFGPAEVSASLADAVFGSCAAGVGATKLNLTTESGRQLPSGVVARWP